MAQAQGDGRGAPGRRVDRKENMGRTAAGKGVGGVGAIASSVRPPSKCPNKQRLAITGEVGLGLSQLHSPDVN